MLSHWESAHEAARWYRDTLSQQGKHARPDAELVFTLPPDNARTLMVLLEYDRGTTGAPEYTRKFTAYLNYQQATGKALPLLVVTASRKATERMQRVLDALAGSLPVGGAAHGRGAALTGGRVALASFFARAGLLWFTLIEVPIAIKSASSREHSSGRSLLKQLFTSQESKIEEVSLLSICYILLVIVNDPRLSADGRR